MLQLSGRAICSTCFRLCVQICLFFKELRIGFKYVLVEISGVEASHGDIEISLNNRCYVTLIHAEMERLDVVIVRQDPVYLGLDQDVWNDCRQVICCYLLIQVEGVGLLDNLHHFL